MARLRSGLAWRGGLGQNAGLQNVGNTCFFNATVQCLSRARPLSRHFLSDSFCDDLNELNPLGCGGRVAREYGETLKRLCRGRERSVFFQHHQNIQTPRTSSSNFGLKTLSLSVATVSNANARGNVARRSSVCRDLIEKEGGPHRPYTYTREEPLN